MCLFALLGALFGASHIFLTVGAAPTNGLHLGEQTLATRNTMTQVPFTFPLANGFPNVSPSTLEAIEHQAGGPLPGSGMGNMKLSTDAGHATQTVAFNEIFEVAFFSELLHNVTHSVPGYELGEDREAVIAALTSSQAQEELHFILANEGLKLSGFAEIEPCAYDFPVSNFTQAIRLADDFSGLLVGAISALLARFAAGGDETNHVVSLFSSVLGQEGQQDGFFRVLQNKVPAPNGWLTPTALNFVYNHIKQNYIVEGSCSQTLDLPDFAKLTPLEMPGAEDTTVWYSTTQSTITSSNYIAYVSGQNNPITVVPISNVKVPPEGLTTFSADFPFKSANFSRGLTVATLVQGTGPFTTVQDVSGSTLAGPALIQVE